MHGPRIGRISVVRDEFAVSRDGMKMFGVMELDQGMHGPGSRSVSETRDKSFRLAITVGYRVFVCENLAFSGVLYTWRATSGNAGMALLPGDGVTDLKLKDEWRTGILRDARCPRHRRQTTNQLTRRFCRVCSTSRRGTPFRFMRGKAARMQRDPRSRRRPTLIVAGSV